MQASKTNPAQPDVITTAQNGKNFLLEGSGFSEKWCLFSVIIII